MILKSYTLLLLIFPCFYLSRILTKLVISRYTCTHKHLVFHSHVLQTSSWLPSKTLETNLPQPSGEVCYCWHGNPSHERRMDFIPHTHSLQNLRRQLTISRPSRSSYLPLSSQDPTVSISEILSTIHSEAMISSPHINC